MPNTQSESWGMKIRDFFGGAFGAGVVLILLPSIALYVGINKLSAFPAVGLPIMAIFGIMILFGACAIVAAVFKRLELADCKQPLALPEGSIRATIALSLIVLFAILSIMLYQSVAQPYKITGLAQPARDAILKDYTGGVVAVYPEEKCPPGAGPPPCYTVIMKSTPGQESTDLAKQLLVLIGTLMTSVTSFYFAARSGVSATTAGAAAAAGSPTPEDGGEQEQSGAADTQRNANANAGADSGGSAADGCDVVVTQANATPDEQLPAAEGGVQR